MTLLPILWQRLVSDGKTPETLFLRAALVASSQLLNVESGTHG